MADVDAHGGIKQVTIEAVVIRADGTVEDRGVVSYWHKNPLRRWWWNTMTKRRGG